MSPGARWAAALALAMPSFAGATEVFVSVSPDGSTRYATQALDSSYRLAWRESAAAPPPPTHRPASGAALQLRPIVARVAQRHGLSPSLVEAVISIESGSNTSAVSPKGAQGAMQLMPATAARYGLKGPTAWRDPERNIDAGARHLKSLLSLHQGNVALALASYNAGEGAVSRYRNRIPPYRETMLYVPAVLARTAASTP